MHIQIDQSGKIERTEVDTVLAFSNEIDYAILIPARVKRRCIAILRACGAKSPYLEIFCAGVFLLIEGHLKKLETITIDEEYTGLEKDIRGMLLSHIRKVRPDFPKENINVARIGRKSRAHERARATYRGRSQPDLVITRPKHILMLWQK